LVTYLESDTGEDKLTKLMTMRGQISVAIIKEARAVHERSN